MNDTEIKVYDLNSIKKQMTTNIYNLLRNKGYDPEDVINVEELLGYRPTVIISTEYDCGYDNEIAAVPFMISFIRCFSNDWFEVYDDDPDVFENCEIANNNDFFIESLDVLYRSLNDLNDKTNEDE